MTGESPTVPSLGKTHRNRNCKPKDCPSPLLTSQLVHNAVCKHLCPELGCHLLHSCPGTGSVSPARYCNMDCVGSSASMSGTQQASMCHDRPAPSCHVRQLRCPCGVGLGRANHAPGATPGLSLSSLRRRDRARGTRGTKATHGVI